jgi:hypothetical protein
MHKKFQGDPFPEITLFTKGYILSIPQFQPVDMLVLIAAIRNRSSFGIRLQYM